MTATPLTPLRCLRGSDDASPVVARLLTVRSDPTEGLLDVPVTYGQQKWRYADTLQHAEGGFHGGLWDDGHDVEYTFYGLGVLALFSGPQGALNNR